jgi:cytoskeletal protein RodZ
MKQNQKNSGNILIVVAIIVLLVLVAWSALKGKTTSPTSYQQNQQTSKNANETIQNESDLISVTVDLDNTDIDSTVDPILNQNSADASQF